MPFVDLDLDGKQVETKSNDKDEEIVHTSKELEYQKEGNNVEVGETEDFEGIRKDFQKLQMVSKTISKELSEKTQQYDVIKLELDNLKKENDHLRKKNSETTDYLNEVVANKDKTVELISLRKDKNDFERLKKLAKKQGDKLIRDIIDLEKKCF